MDLVYSILDSSCSGEVFVEFTLKINIFNTMSVYRLVKVKSKYRNLVRLERAAQQQFSDSPQPRC